MQNAGMQDTKNARLPDAGLQNAENAGTQECKPAFYLNRSSKAFRALGGPAVLV